MKQTIPFTKDITFKTKIGDLTSISLDNDLTLKGEDLIVGNFYLKGTYKQTKASAIEEEYSYKIPCEIAISDDYDTFDATVDIDDFHYEIVNDEVLRVNIIVIIDKLTRKEKPIPIESKKVEIVVNEDRTVTMPEEKPNIVKLDKPEEKYFTYSVYITRQEDTLEEILTKYQVTKEQLCDYNDLTNLNPGTKLIIPSFTNND